MYYACFLENTNEKLIFDNYEECKQKVKGNKARYKKFKTIIEARNWLDDGAKYEKKVSSIVLPSDAIYFDAGTGRGIGVEVRVSDVNKNSLLHKIMPKEKINQFGNYLLSKGRTNNFGELTGLFISLKYAEKYNVLKIYGDSELILKYWAKGHYNKDNLDEDTINLIKRVNLMYEKYINNGGQVLKVSGDYNPADLGFHK